ncbi:unnamed protein product [Effrenium voratum]|nr:unnamed protein product [Effrenium voratum]
MTETAPSIFLCDNGFLVGAALPTCTPLPCSYSFPDGPGVEHNCDGVRSAETCTATCTAVGYTYSSGNSAATFTCQPTGSFTGDTPTCERVQCSDLSLGASFQHTCRGQRYEDTCSVGCAKGYSLVSTSGQFTCQANQSFTGALPTCTGNPCNQPRSNAALNTTGCNSVTTSETCEVTCQPGFEPNTSSLTCDATGYLLGAAPSCKPSQCPTHSALQDPTLRSNCAGVTYGSRCAVFCAPGHSSNGSAAEEWRCDLSGGSLGLQGVAPVCEPQACTSGLPAGDSSVSSNCSNLKTGETCVQNCAFGYSSTAPTSAYTCSEDGTASGSSAACQPVPCDHALSVTGLDHTCAGVVFGGHCFTMCAAGYNATGTKYQRLLCEGVSAGSLVPGLTETNGVGLRGSLPSCEPLPCLYNLPVGGVYDHNCDGVKTGESCVVSCAAGFWGTPQTLQCDGTSSLTGSMPSCAVATSTVTVTTVTATSTTTVTTQPFLCTSAFLPSIEGASNFSCAGDPGVGQICRSPCDDVMSADVQAVVICWTDQRWRVSEACLSAASSQQLTVIFVVTLSVLCTVMLLSGGVLYVLGGGGSGGVKIHPKVEPPPSFEPKEAPPGGAEPLKEPPPPKSDDQQLLADYSWSRRPVHPVDMDFMCAESFLQPGQLVARPPALPMAFTTRGQPSAGLSQLDEMFAGPEPPQLQSLRQTAVVQVEEDASFRVWVQHLPPDTSSYQAGETA